SQDEVADLAHHVPGFWAQRYRVIEFQELPKAEQALSNAMESAWEGAGHLEDVQPELSEAGLLEIQNGGIQVSTRVNLHLALWILNWRKGDYERAERFLRNALTLADTIQDNRLEARCLNALALLSSSMERSDEAIHAYKQAIHLAPHQIDAWNNLGNLCAKT